MYFYFLPAAIAIPILGYSQGKFLDRVNIKKSNGTVVLTWTISSGNTCDGISIKRSLDTTNFYLIGEISGICGSIIEPADFRYADHSPVINRINYYKLEFENVGVSDMLFIEVFDYNRDNYMIKPNPVIEESKIYFNNEKSEKHFFTLYTLSGNKILSLNTYEDYFTLNANHLPSGLFFFTIIPASEKSVIPGKLVIK